MKPVKIVLLCGPTAAGKSFATERVLSVEYEVATAKLDSLYRAALEHAGAPREDGRPYSVLKAAHAIREEHGYGPEVSARFFEKLDELLRTEIEQAGAWGVGLVLEGYTSRFADEAERIVDVARSVCGSRFSVARIHMRPSLDAWNRNRAEKLDADPSKPDYYERNMAPPEPTPEVEDHTAGDLDELRRLANDVVGLRRHKWYQRFSLGPITTQGSSDASEKVDAIAAEDIAGKRVLDLCCATGVHAIMVKDRGAAAVAGVEMNPARYCKSLELRKTLLRHSDVDARVAFRLGEVTSVLPTLRRFDTVTFFGALHYFPDYEAILGSVARVADRAVYLEVSFAEGEHDATKAPGAIRPYTRSRTGTTIYMGDPDTVARTIERAMPLFALEDRTPISAPGTTLVARREIWRLKHRGGPAEAHGVGEAQVRASTGT